MSDGRFLPVRVFYGSLRVIRAVIDVINVICGFNEGDCGVRVYALKMTCLYS